MKMQIVIDIDEDLYKSIIGHRCKIIFQQRCDYEDLKNAIEDGTSLPKGHGRLIDADRVIAEATEKMKYPSNYEYMECVIAHMNLAPTIIAESEE
jgi:hypothetical protein